VSYDQPILTQVSIKHFINADDTALLARNNNFQGIERVLDLSLRVMSDNFDENFLKPNPTKTQICDFHLKNRQAERKLRIKYQGAELKNSAHPKYLEVTLDQSLTFLIFINCTLVFIFISK